MKMVQRLILVAGALIVSASMLGFNSSEVHAQNGYGKQKVVYHINDIDHAKAAFRNITNHLNAIGDENADIVVVTHSSGAYALVQGAKDHKGNTFDATVQALANRGVKFEICNNTIKGKHIDRDSINMNAEIVPSGVAQLAHLEQQGYVYLKP